MPEKRALSLFTQNARHEMRESQLEFAEHCGICAKTLSEIELGNANPTLKVMQRIAAYTGATVAQMLTVEPVGKVGVSDEAPLPPDHQVL